MATLVSGKLVDKKVTQKVYSKLHKGTMSTAHGIVVHQTGAPTAQHTFNSYTNAGANGAHFLIDKQSSIYQTALTNQITYHEGKLRSRCLQTNVCNKSETAAATNILYAKGQSFGVRVKKLHAHEKAKAYPDRYPTNSDAIGVELVGNFDKTKQTFDAVNSKQNASLKWLVAELTNLLSLTTADIYRHPTVSRKQASEASTATW